MRPATAPAEGVKALTQHPLFASSSAFESEDGSSLQASLSARGSGEGMMLSGDPGRIPMAGALDITSSTLRLKQLLTSMTACRTLLRKAWNSDRDRHPQERAFLAHECERLKELVNRLETRDPETLTDAFWAEADTSMDTARTLSGKSPHSSFAVCRAIVPSSFIQESQKVRPLSNYVNTSLVCSRSVDAGRKVLCTSVHLKDSSIMYAGCTNGEVLSITLPSTSCEGSVKVMPSSHVYPVTHILCTALRERDLPATDVFTVSGGFDKTVRVLQGETRVYRVLQWHRGAISAMCCWGGQLITAGYEGSLVVWDITRRSCKPLLPVVESAVTSLLAEGQLLIVGYKTGSINVYVSPNAAALNTACGPPPVRLCYRFGESAPMRRDIPMQFVPQQTRGLRSHMGTVTCIALRDDMATLFTGGSDTYVIKWLLHKKQQAWKVKAHASSVTCILPVGQSLLVTAGDDLLKLWDEGNMVPIRVISPHYCAITSVVKIPLPDEADARSRVSSFAEKRLKRNELPSMVTTCEGCVDVWVFETVKQKTLFA